MTSGQLTPPIGPEDHRKGRDDAPITLVEYGDFECPYCGAAYPVVQAVRRLLGDELRVVFRNFPLKEAHPHAEHAAEAAEAVGAQGKFWEMHDQLFEHQDALEDSDLVSYAKAVGADSERVSKELGDRSWEKRVRSHFRSGVRSGVNGTPTFFVNGVRFDADWRDPAEFAAAMRAIASETART
jgi:protein-disulfide isomerase